MADIGNIQAEIKDVAGKGAARRIRRAGRVPAVIYGGKQEPSMVTLDPRDVVKGLNREGFFSHLLDIKVGKDKHRVIPRAVQLHPVSDRPQHVDFLRVDAKTMLDVMVPLHFINQEDSPGLKRGGVLNIVRHEIEVSCLASEIPESFEIDLSEALLGDSLHSSLISLPKGVEFVIDDRDFTLATIASPSALRSEEDEAEDEAEEEEEDDKDKED